MENITFNNMKEARVKLYKKRILPFLSKGYGKYKQVKITSKTVKKPVKFEWVREIKTNKYWLKMIGTSNEVWYSRDDIYGIEVVPMDLVVKKRNNDEQVEKLIDAMNKAGKEVCKGE